MQIKTETKVGIFVIIALGILGYISVYLGVFNWHFRKYEPYTAHFKDVSGLIKKADAKIAGVKVGWVEGIKLSADGDQAAVTIMISDRYKIYADSFVEVQQEGLLGPKYLDIVPGSSKSGLILPGGIFSKKGRATVSIEDLMYKFDNIAQNIEDVSDSLKKALGTQEQQKNIQQIVDNMSKFSDMMAKNKDGIGKIVENLDNFSQSIVPIGENLQKLTKSLDEKILPSFQENMEKISDVFDRDFDKVAQKVTTTFDKVQSVADKVDKGEGLLGKLVNDDAVYDDLKSVTCTLKNVADSYDKMGLVVDSHSESMVKLTDGYQHKNNKGYFGLRLQPSDSMFYSFQVVASERGGVVGRDEIMRTYFDSSGKELTPAEVSLVDAYSIKPATVKETKLERNTIKYSYQIGKKFNNLAFRFGAFEGYFGIGADFDMPFKSDKFRWITTLEAFDFKGQERLSDRNPHLKWLNKIFFLDNFYATFGVDDFISKNNANPFFGVGLRFGDDDVKSLVGKFGLPK